jgi:long-chain acyl-CoA synthetase
MSEAVSAPQSTTEPQGLERWQIHYPKDVDHSAPIPVVPLFSLMDDAVAKYGNRPLIDFLDKKYTYAEIGALVDRAAAGLQRQGVGRGTKVGLFLPNCPYYTIFYFGILKAGGTVVNFNPLYAEKELEKQCLDSDTKMMVTLDLAVLYPKIKLLLDQGVLKHVVVCPFAEALPFPKNFKDRARVEMDSRHIAYRTLIGGAAKPQPVTIDPKRDIAVLQYTGGTTGLPKGAMLSHANLYCNAMQAVRWFPGMHYGTESVVGILPFFHVFAMTVVQNLAVASGSEIIMLPRFDLDQTLELISKKKPTLMAGVPTIYTAMNNHKELSKYDLTSLRFCMSGGAPLPVEVKQKFEELTGCILVEGYGLTESSPIAFGNPFDGRIKAGSIGLPMPNTWPELRDLEDPTKRVAHGEKGELCLKGPQVMMGYWKRPEETEKTFVGEFLRTGDVGYMDDEGFVYLVDRIKDVVLCGGYNVYPRIVEEAIYQHDSVQEVTVIGIPDEYRGETVKAFVVLKVGENLTVEDLTEFLKTRISPIEMPKKIEFRTELPKTMIGKLSKKELVAEERAKYEASKARKG